jgi:hypothetical protein
MGDDESKPQTFPITQSDLEDLETSFRNLRDAMRGIGLALAAMNQPQATAIAKLCNTVAEEFEAIARVWNDAPDNTTKALAKPSSVGRR